MDIINLSASISKSNSISFSPRPAVNNSSFSLSRSGTCCSKYARHMNLCFQVFFFLFHFLFLLPPCKVLSNSSLTDEGLLFGTACCDLRTLARASLHLATSPKNLNHDYIIIQHDSFVSCKLPDLLMFIGSTGPGT